MIDSLYLNFAPKLPCTTFGINLPYLTESDDCCFKIQVSIIFNIFCLNYLHDMLLKPCNFNGFYICKKFLAQYQIAKRAGQIFS